MGVARIEKRYELTLKEDTRELGEFAYKVLMNVAEYRWDEALRFMSEYRASKTHPVYVKRTARLFEHCEELILAIKSKKTFPNLGSLAQNKQEELHEKARMHWEELRASFRRLRMIERQIALEDARSTVWVVKTFTGVVFIFLTIMLIWEATRNLGHPVVLVFDEFGEWVMHLIGL